MNTIVRSSLRAGVCIFLTSNCGMRLNQETWSSVNKVMAFVGSSFVMVLIQSCSTIETYSIAEISARFIADSMKVSCADMRIQKNCSDSNIFVDGTSSYGGSLVRESITTKAILDSLHTYINVNKRRNAFVGDTASVSMAQMHFFAQIDALSGGSNDSVLLSGTVDYKIYDPEFAEYSSSFFRDSVSGCVFASKNVYSLLSNPDSVKLDFAFANKEGMRFRFSNAIRFSSKVVSYASKPSM